MNIKQIDSEKLIGIVALLVHAAKIDDNYTEKEKKIIISFIENFEQNSREIQEKLKKAEELEANSNQLLNYTNKIKKDALDLKSMVVKELWKIIISDNSTDEYESNLIRRICGLIYFPDKLSGEIKLKLLKEKIK
tara:strand:+ start:4399 stop:4803 length:405 start_codon:yes stop_codon:yes gene_type:complete